MADDFYLVKIGTVTLSTDGTDGGAACLTKVDNLDQLFGGWIGVTRIPLSGDPFNFVAQNEGKNVKIITKPFVVSQTVLDSLKTLINTAAQLNSVIEVSISNGPGSVNVDCKPFWEGEKLPIGFSSNFNNPNLYDVEIRLISVGYTAAP